MTGNQWIKQKWPGPRQGVLGELRDGEALHWWEWGVSPWVSPIVGGDGSLGGGSGCPYRAFMSSFVSTLPKKHYQVNNKEN